jgi:peptide chain release factor 1
MDGDVQDVLDACRTFFAAEALRDASRDEPATERRA